MYIYIVYICIGFYFMREMFLMFLVVIGLLSDLYGIKNVEK